MKARWVVRQAEPDRTAGSNHQNSLLGQAIGAAASKQKDRLRGPKSEAGLDEQRR